MATRKTNYAFERNQRAKAKAAKRQAKLQAKAAAKPREASPEPAAAPAGNRNAGTNGDPSCT